MRTPSRLGAATRLVGGLYGVALGGAFFGESMFSRASDASKVALAHLVRQLEQWGFRFIDCQLPTPHLEPRRGDDPAAPLPRPARVGVAAARTDGAVAL